LILVLRFAQDSNFGLQDLIEWILCAIMNAKLVGQLESWIVE